METVNNASVGQKSYSIFCIVYIYIFLYSPVINGIPVPTPLFLVPFTYNFFFRNSGQISRYINLFRNESILLLFLMVYVFFLDFVYGRNVYFTHVFYYIFDVFPLSFFIVDFFFKNKSKEWFFQTIIFIGVIAASISICSYLSPAVNNFLSAIIKGNQVSDNTLGRNYGLAIGYLYSYPLCQGIIAVLALKMVSTNKLYIVYFFVLLISIIINARIGLIPIVLFLILNLKWKSIATAALFIFAFISANKSGLFADYQELVDWNLDMFYDFSDFFFSTAYSDYGTGGSFFTFITENFLVYPTTTFGWTFGELREVFSDPIKNSDIGYINDLIYGGLVLVIFVALYYLKISIRLWQIKDKDSKLFSVLFLLIFLIANIKGEFFRPSPVNRIMVLILVYFVYNSFFVNQIDLKENQLTDK